MTLRGTSAPWMCISIGCAIGFPKIVIPSDQNHPGVGISSGGGFMKIRLAIRNVATGALLLMLLTGVLIGTFFLTAWLYHTIGHAPPPFLIQEINALLGLVLYAAIIVGFFSLIN